MNRVTLHAISSLRHLSQSDLARLAGVSRQAVSRWFRLPDAKQGPHPIREEIEVKSSTLKHLAQGLSIHTDALLNPLPLLDDPEATKRYTTKLLWDRLYPGLDAFAIALTQGEPPALARLVQVYGVYRSSKIAGQKIWSQFPQYKQYIRPVRREEIETAWQFHQNHKSK